ncbi:MAG: hypothetical protein ACOX50_03675, partial [Patescibacteria group bacterium]
MTCEQSPEIFPLFTPQIVLKNLEKRSLLSEGRLLTFESTPPGPESLYILTRQAVDEKGKPIPKGRFFGFINGVPPHFVEMVIIQAEQTRETTLGSWSWAGSEEEHGLKKCRVIQASRLTTPDRRAALIGREAWTECHQLNSIYGWETVVSSITIPKAIFIAKKQLLSQPNYFDLLALEFLKPRASMKHPESQKLAQMLFKKSRNQGGWLYDGGELPKGYKGAPKPDTVWLWGNVVKKPREEFDEARVLVF